GGGRRHDAPPHRPAGVVARRRGDVLHGRDGAVADHAEPGRARARRHHGRARRGRPDLRRRRVPGRAAVHHAIAAPGDDAPRHASRCTTASGSPARTWSPGRTGTSTTRPPDGARTGSSSFIASSTTTGAPSVTRPPRGDSTRHTTPPTGARRTTRGRPCTTVEAPRAP